MPDEPPREIIVPQSVRYGVWPGNRALCVEATSDDGTSELWLQHVETGETSELRAYRFGMFRSGCR